MFRFVFLLLVVFLLGKFDLGFSAPFCAKDENIPTAKDVATFISKNLTVDKDKAFFAKGLFQGDMVGYRINSVNSTTQQVQTPDAITADAIRWPNKIIPYIFYKKIDKTTRDFAKKAMDDIEAKSCIRFIPQTFEADYIKISPGLSCASQVGYSSGEHIVSLNPGCFDGLGATQHEFLHALGIIHEQSRPDRDTYVFINYTNISPDNKTRTQFYIFENAQVTDLGIPYDYNSVMHYPYNAFAINSQYPTVMPKTPGKSIGNRDKLSTLDIQRLNKLYRCDDNPRDTKTTISPDVDKKYTQTFSQYSKLCDGNRDTLEGWDENPDVCLKMCRKLDSTALGPEKQNLINLPGSNQCIHKNSLCKTSNNSSYDPINQAENCKRYCRLGGYIPIPQTSQCIHSSKLCDGHVDTRGGYDEKPESCKELCGNIIAGLEGVLFSFGELNNRCFPKSFLCNGLNTGALTDKANCKKYCTGDGYYPIGESMQCGHWSSLCNGEIETESAADEDPKICKNLCQLASKDLGGLLFNAPETDQCLSKRDLCNGFMNTHTTSTNSPDFCEQNCKGNGFIVATDSDQCIRLTDLCDGKMDARSGWDEDVANCKKACKSTGGWPPAPQQLVLNSTTFQCMLTGKTETKPQNSRSEPETTTEAPTEDTGEVLVGTATDQSTTETTGEVLIASVDDNGNVTPQTTGESSTQSQESTTEQSNGGPTETTGEAASQETATAEITTQKPKPKEEATKGETSDTTSSPKPYSKELKIFNGKGQKKNMTCKTHERITVESAVYTSQYSSSTCPDTDALKDVVAKCKVDRYMICGVEANDPSTDRKCKSRPLVIKYTCKPNPAWATFTADNIDAATLNLNGGEKPTGLNAIPDDIMP